MDLYIERRSDPENCDLASGLMFVWAQNGVIVRWGWL